MVNKTNSHTHQHESDPTFISIPELRAAFHGQVIGPGDPDYDKARTVFYGGIDRHPAVIIRAADAGEVARVVSLARESGFNWPFAAADTASPVTVFRKE